ncbi:hypothetical protein GCM10010363_08860 [Streptomyces omiyaensis]|uniref:hypothetical protein n=1 Tax=Streptomyces omiyaensis TaxID=68247 RepID=UPI0016778149|nr:hypothetical protein [Streptomyces omiyaensis]GGY30525.1 hypothetical protein GCM10010363_08860 [Streptomyces omiyaensis]
MAKYTLASYAVRIRKSRENDYLHLDNFDNAGGDLLKEFYGFLLSLQERPFEVQRTERSLEAHTIRHESRSLRFKLGSGSFGTQSRIRERSTGQVVFQKEEDHVDLTDLRNYLIIPHGSTTGLLFTERLQGNGVIATLSEAFRKAFNQKYSGYTLELNNMTSEAAFGIYLERGDLKKIRLVRQAIPDDVADALGMGETEKNLGSIEFVLKPPRLGSFGKRKIQKVISGEADVGSMLEWRGLEYEEMKIEVKIANSTRTLSVSSGTTPAMLYDLDSELQKDNQTTITDDWVYAKAKEFAEEVAENMGISAAVMRREFAWPELWELYRLEAPNEQHD